MAQITTNQHSYSNVAALLNVEATATRTGTGTVSITANWHIYTAGSSYSGATRYLVLLIGSESGPMYYSTAIGSNWSKQTDYEGSYTFAGIPLSADVTEITIGFGVSGSNTSLSKNGTLIWNGKSEVSSSYHDPDIQFNKITGIEKGYTSCTAPTSFTASPEVFENSVALAWSEATGGTNNTITGYEIEYATSLDGSAWSSWAALKTVTGTSTADVPGIDRGQYVKYRIRTQGSAGEQYFSDWIESNISTKDDEPYVYIPNEEKDPERYLAYIHDATIDPEEPFGKYMPYVFDGQAWQRHS